MKYEWVEEDRATFTAEAETQADADKAIEAQLRAKGWEIHPFAKVDQIGKTEYTNRVILEGQLVEYTYVAGIEYTPAKYEWIDGTWEEVKH